MIVPPSTRVRVGAARRSCRGEPWMRKTSSHASFFVCRFRPRPRGRHFAAGRVASFAEGRIGCREWARSNGRLEDIYSVDDRLDHDLDEPMGNTLDI